MDPDRFEQVVGGGHVWVPAGETLDGVPFSLVVRPGSADELAGCLREAHARGCALIPMGSGSKLGWGNVPRAHSLVRLDLSRLTERTDVDPQEGVATVGAGVRVSDLDRELGAHGKRTGLATPWVDATVGGTIAADAFGPELAPGRRPRDELLGLEVVLADGTPTRCGGRVVKNVTGFDLVRLHCGAQGTLGVIARATFRLRPRPESRWVLGCGFERWPAALEAAHGLLVEGVRPAGLGLIPTEEGLGLRWVLEGSARDVAERGRRRPGERLSEADWAAVGHALVREPGEDVALRLAGRPSDTLGMLGALEAAAGADGLRAVLPAAGVVFADVPAEGVEALLARVQATGWACLVESAAPELKQRLDVFAPPVDTLPLMRALKQRFDPRGILSPGRYAGRI